MTVGQNVLMRDASGAIVAGKPVAGVAFLPKIHVFREFHGTSYLDVPGS